MEVFKFGGASIKDAVSVRNVTDILRNYRNKPLVVVLSAMGKTTDALEAIMDNCFYGNGTPLKCLNEVKQQHLIIVNQLIDENRNEVYKQLNHLFDTAASQFKMVADKDYRFVYDQVVSVGELASTRIVSAFLKQEGVDNVWIDARQYIRTDNTFRQGQVNWKITEKKIREEIGILAEQKMVITQGFLGGTIENQTTTLGRDGSDFSSAIFAYSLDAEKVSIWKNVPGVLNADPCLVPNAQKLMEISYKEAIEMTYHGAKVIHPKTIKPLQHKGIKLVVRSFKNHNEPGTIIYKSKKKQRLPPVLIIKENQVLLSVSMRDFLFINEKNLSRIYGLFSKHQIKINLAQNSAFSFSASVDFALNRVKHLIDDLEQDFNVLQDRDLKLVTIQHYTPKAINEHTNGMKILLEQKCPQTIQLLGI